jgi:carboxylesterase
MKTGCLLIHGFTGAPFEVNPLAEFLSERTDWDIVVPTLPGHGDNLQLKGIQSTQWMNCAEEELQTLMNRNDEVYIIGFSMGGLIASDLSVRYPIKKLVLLSAAIKYIHLPQILIEVRSMIKAGITGKLLKNEWFLHYQRKINQTPLSATRQFRKVVKFTMPSIKKVTIPTFIAQGEKDGIVPPYSANLIYKQILSEEKQLYFDPNSRHLICHADANEELFNRILTFLQK